ncbi:MULTISPECIES: RapH phosphatase inhibitor [unclassified Bacillus (in: firmicutes)]|uniref:RapH phosphatase inhibitor n=1 Tax=unclassified Bacillus (in: firmicutes) TaxID=185979 RepID=UPI000D0295E0|nr:MULTISPECIES: RapH phosphatase inhibitor [unclassified Bacillus (in: firmicutes)]PRS82881.1 RapH phosphatase inhibitor [Bacillus sp. CJCL2]PRS87629.1 RapH phosphatase inhibitor [Bacillus sp. YBWC18]
MSIKKMIVISSIIFLGAGVYEASSTIKPASNRNTTMEDSNRNTIFIPQKIDRNTASQNV